MDEKISVIVPIYNVASYLEQCVLSICAQTYQSLEIILVDDGSNDGSEVICDRFAEKDHRILVVHQKNQGLVRARKTGLELATGDFIGFVDGDDYVEPNMYENLLCIQKQSKADIVHTGYMTDHTKYLPNTFFMGSDQFGIADQIKECVLETQRTHFVMSSVWSKLFKAKLIKKCYCYVPDTQSYGEDLICLVACLCQQISIQSVAEAYYHYTIRANSISHAISSISYRNEMDLYDALVNTLKEFRVYDSLESDVNDFLTRQMQKVLSKAVANPFAVQRYQFCNVDMLQDKKVVLYGAGAVGRDYYTQLSRQQRITIVAWADKDNESYHYGCCQIDQVDCLVKKEYDYVIIAVLDQRVVKEIQRELLRLGIQKEKIIWFRPEEVR